MGLQERELREEFKEAYRDFSLNVVEDRAIPEYRDGLKPIQRRILYSLFSDFNTKKFHTSARVVGDIIGKYHPHGDDAAYFALVRMAQPFLNRVSFLEIQGNFGSIDGDEPAAKRYTGVRASRKFEETVKGYLDTSKMVPNYDFTLEEPELIPLLIPNALITMTQGISVGFMTSIVPHNLGECLKALKKIIQGKILDLKSLLQVVLGPDFPLGGVILNTREEILETYSKGKGIFSIASSFKETKEGVQFTSIPPHISKSNLLKNLVSNLDSFPEIEEIFDNSTGEKIKIDLHLKVGESEKRRYLVRRLYKKTLFMTKIYYNNLFLNHKRPQVYPLFDLFLALLEHHRSIIFKKSEILLFERRTEEHLSRGVLKVLEDIEPFVNFVKKNPREKVWQFCKERYGFDEAQFEKVMGVRLSQLTSLEREKLNLRVEFLKGEIMFHQQIIEDKDALDRELLNQYTLLENFSLSRITSFEQEFKEENMFDLIRNLSGSLILDKDGFFVFNSFEGDHKLQKRGGQGKQFLQNSEGFSLISPIETHDRILIFTNHSRLYSDLLMNMVEIEGIESHNRHYQEIFNFSQGERISFLGRVPQQVSEDLEGVIVTSFGRVRRVLISGLITNRISGMGIGSLEEGEEVIFFSPVSLQDQLLISSSQGRAIRFKVSQIPLKLRSSKGVIGYVCKEGETCTSATLVETDHCSGDILISLESGIARRFPLSLIPLTNRGGRGVFLTTSSSSICYVASIPLASSVVIAITTQNKCISFHLSMIRSSSSRRGKGVQMVKKPENGKIFMFFD